MARMLHGLNRSVHEGMNDISNVQAHVKTSCGNVNIEEIRAYAELALLSYPYLSRGMRFPTMWYVRPAKSQTSLRIRKSDQSLC